jgi:1,4-dihydroxy-2-naphthoate octaprenyltransferase
VDGVSSGASVFFARDGHDLLFFTFNPSRKAEQIRINPRVQAVIWPKSEEGIRGLQIEGGCHQVRQPGEQRLAHDKILEVTDAFRSYMDDAFLTSNRVVGYYRIRPTLTKYVDFHGEPQFQWREYPENQVGAMGSMLESVLGRLRLWVRAVRAPFLEPICSRAARRRCGAGRSSGSRCWALSWPRPAPTSPTIMAITRPATTNTTRCRARSTAAAG